MLNLSDQAKFILEKRYLKKDKEGKIAETPEDMFMRVAKTVSEADKEYGNESTMTEKFYEMMTEGWVMPATPILANIGRPLSMGSSCFGLVVPDSMDGIFDTLKDGGMIYKAGGGVGYSFSNLRPKGDKISTTNGETSGVCSFMEIFDKLVDTIKQGGCVARNTMIATTHGIIPIEELDLCSLKDKNWVNHTINVHTDEGIKVSNALYNNGNAHVITIKTDKGFSVTATPEHKFRVINNNGDYVWKQLSEIKHGDWCVLQMGFHPDNINYKFKPLTNKFHFNCNKIITPQEPSRELGEIIGYIIGNGSFTENEQGIGRVAISLPDNQPDQIKYVTNIMKKLFNLDPPKPNKKPNDASINLHYNSIMLYQWCKLNGLYKENSKTATIPKAVFMASKEFAYGFICGLFSADGCLSKSNNVIHISSASYNLLKDLQLLLLSLNIPSRICGPHIYADRYSKGEIYRLNVISYNGYKNFKKDIKFLSDKKNSNFIEHSTMEFNDIIPNQGNVFRELFNNTHNRKFYRRIGHYFTDVKSKNRKLTRARLQYLYKNFEEVKGSKLDRFITFNQFYDQIISIEYSECNTLDLSVPENNTYIANGFVSHNTRRGAALALLDCSHPEIFDFIKSKINNDKFHNFNISVNITDKFIDAVQNNSKFELINPRNNKTGCSIYAKELWKTIAESAWKCGDPGLLFLDTANFMYPSTTKVDTCNPCVTGDALIPTEYGLKRIDELLNDNNTPLTFKYKDLSSNNDSNSTITQVICTGVKEVFEIKTRSGYKVKATSNHKILTTNGWKEVKDLTINDSICLQNEEGPFNKNDNLPFIVDNNIKLKNNHTTRYKLPQKWTKELGQFIGWLIGDGTFYKDKNGVYKISLGFNNTNKHHLISYFKDILQTIFEHNTNSIQRENNMSYLSCGSAHFGEFFNKIGVKAVKAKHKEIPYTMFTAPREAIIGVLQALFSSDGTTQVWDKNQTRYIRLSSKSLRLLEQVQILLINFGIKSRIYDRCKEPEERFEYTRKNGEKKKYLCDGEFYELQISRDNIPTFIEKIGFMDGTHDNNINKLKTLDYYKSKFQDEIKSITYIGEEKVYDLTEPITNAFIANGIVVHNCNELNLENGDSCNLIAINLSKLYDPTGCEATHHFKWSKFNELVHLCVHFMDNVITINKYPTKFIEQVTLGNRRMGLGVMGFTDLLVKSGIPYDSEKARELADKISYKLTYEAAQASEKLAIRRGTFPNVNKLKDNAEQISWMYSNIRRRRNLNLTTCQPTGSVSIITNCSASIEPYFALSYRRDHLVDDNKSVIVTSQVVLEKLFDLNYISTEVINIIEETGSIQSCKQIPQEVKNIFKIASEITPEDHIKMQAAWQKNIDSGISKTINMPESTTVEDIEKAYMLAYQLGCKGITVYRDKSKPTQVFNMPSKKVEKKEGEIVLTPRKRPTRTTGITERIRTSDGNLYVTVNNDEVGPCETFIHIGKHGSDLMAWSEAVGRLISLALRAGLTVEQVAKQLVGITGRPLISNGKTILSVPDGIGKLLLSISGNGNTKKIEEDARDTFQSPCPECGSPLVRSEGCKKCLNCNYSTCG